MQLYFRCFFKKNLYILTQVPRIVPIVEIKLAGPRLLLFHHKFSCSNISKLLLNPPRPPKETTIQQCNVHIKMIQNEIKICQKLGKTLCF